ncbi:MAG: type II toxin-antitoxin system VapB family antitoxin [Devosia sp.]|nr:type II toxin-antitoxin system VapB family antitoxin [Devosia sp.]
MRRREAYVYPIGIYKEAKIANVFRSNRSQAVRLPKAAEFPPEVTEVEVIVEGDRRVLVPKKKPGSWKEYFERGPFLSDDFPDEIEDLPPADDVSFDD